MKQNTKTALLTNPLLVLQPIAVRVTASGEKVESSKATTKRVWVRVKSNREFPMDNPFDPKTTAPYFYAYSFK